MNNIAKFLIVASVAAVVMSAEAQSVLTVSDKTIQEPATIIPRSAETDTKAMLESWYLKNYAVLDHDADSKDSGYLSDEVLLQRLQALPTVIEMPLNSVVKNAIKYYAGRKQLVENLLGLSLYYMPIFEQALEEQGLPLELKYLPIIESGLNPNAVSKHGATGLWQFMLGTAKGLGLEVTSLVDERRDPYVSSERAASYLKDLYATYGDWSLAIAAYNCGPGNVNKAIRRAGGEAKDHDFWSIYNYLSPETRGYVPMFIAANYVMTYYPEHNISPVLPVKPLVMDTLQVANRVHFNQISKVLDIPVEELRILNPQFRADVIPGTPESPYTLILPSQQIHAYLMSEKEIHNFEPDKYGRRGTVDPGEVPADAMLAVEGTEVWPDDMGEADVAFAATQGKASVIMHKVVAGESLASIAEQYGVTPAEIKASNNLRRNAVRVGQQLRISTSSPQAVMETTVAAVTGKSKASASKKKSKAKTQTKKSGPITHKLRNGESLSSLSKKYGVSIAEIKKANGMTNDKLRAGKTIKIPAKTTAKKSGKKKSKKRRR